MNTRDPHLNAESGDDELSRMVADQAERLFAGIATKDTLIAADAGAWPDAAWREIADAGMPEALLPEEAGGSGIACRDALALAGRAAWHAVPLPLAETMMARALWAACGGDGADAFAGRPLTLAASAQAQPLRAYRDDGAGDGGNDSGNGAGWRVSGALRGVPWPAQAGAVLAAAVDDAGVQHLALVPLEPASIGATVNSNLAREPRGDLTFDGLVLPAPALRTAPWLAPLGLLPWGALLRANQMAGAMARCVAHALQYANEREQFGRAISKFPAVQDLLVQAAAQTSAASAAVAFANARWPWLADGPLPPDFLLACAVAKARTGEAAGIVAAACHQVHGAMGFTQEHPLHYSTRRLWSWRDECGNEAFWQRELGRWACAVGGEALWPALTAL